MNHLLMGLTYATPKYGSKQLNRDCMTGVGLQEGNPGWCLSVNIRYPMNWWRKNHNNYPIFSSCNRTTYLLVLLLGNIRQPFSDSIWSISDSYGPIIIPLAYHQLQLASVGSFRTVSRHAAFKWDFPRSFNWDFPRAGFWEAFKLFGP